MEEFNSEKVKEIKADAVRTTCIYWVLAIFSLTILLFVALYLSKRIMYGDNLLTGIQNFSTVISIILSISSIIFAVFTSRETTSQYINITRAVEEIRTTNKFMNDNNNKVMQYVHELTRDIAHIDENIRTTNNRTPNQAIPHTVHVPSNNSQINDQQEIIQ